MLEFFKNHPKKTLAALVLVFTFLWNFIVVPLAATNALVLPPLTIEHLQSALSFLVGV